MQTYVSRHFSLIANSSKAMSSGFKFNSSNNRISFKNSMKLHNHNEMDPDEKGFLLAYLLVFLVIFTFGVIGRLFYKSNEVTTFLLYLKYQRKSTSSNTI